MNEEDADMDPIRRKILTKRVLSLVVAGLLPAVAFAQGAQQKIR
jgi:hypothetical protein